MKFLWIFPYYLGWHYGRGLVEMFIIFKDFLFFVPKFFSLGTLLKTLFSPFQRLKEHYDGGLEIEKFLEVITVNIIMRIVGVMIRLFIILIGVIAFIVTFIVEILLFVLWLCLPFLLAFAFITSLIALFKN